MAPATSTCLPSPWSLAQTCPCVPLMHWLIQGPTRQCCSPIRTFWRMWGASGSTMAYMADVFLQACSWSAWRWGCVTKWRRSDSGHSHWASTSSLSVTTITTMCCLCLESTQCLRSSCNFGISIRAVPWDCTWAHVLTKMWDLSTSCFKKSATLTYSSN